MCLLVKVAAGIRLNLDSKDWKDLLDEVMGFAAREHKEHKGGGIWPFQGVVFFTTPVPRVITLGCSIIVLRTIGSGRNSEPYA
jgi:hypothetical protein